MNEGSNILITRADGTKPKLVPIPAETYKLWKRYCKKYRYQKDLLEALKNAGISTTKDTLRRMEDKKNCSPATLLWIEKIVELQNKTA